MSLADLVLRWELSQPVYHEDRDPRLAGTKRAQLAMIAEAIADAAERTKWPGPPEELARLVEAVGYGETRYSLRIHGGECRPHECDRGRAHGPWQQHPSARVPQEVWEQLEGVDPAATRLAALTAARALSAARYSCRSLEKRAGDWLALTLQAYGRGSCLAYYKGVELRIAEFKRLESVR